MSIRISQITREVLAQPTTQKVRISQVVREVLAQPTTQNIRISQVVREVVIQQTFGLPIIPDSFLSQPKFEKHEVIEY